MMTGYEVMADMQPTRAEIERVEGPVLLEFGARWCGHCRALARLLEDHPQVRHIKIEDGPGKPLGRSFGVRLWPTLVFMKGGRVVGQVARPGLREVLEGLEAIDGRGLSTSCPGEPDGIPTQGR